MESSSFKHVEELHCYAVSPRISNALNVNHLGLYDLYDIHPIVDRPDTKSTDIGYLLAQLALDESSSVRLLARRNDSTSLYWEGRARSISLKGSAQAFISPSNQAVFAELELDPFFTFIDDYGPFYETKLKLEDFDVVAREAINL